MLDPLMAGDVDDVAETFIGQHAGARALVLQYGIGRRRGAVQHVVNVARCNAVVAANLGDALDDAA